jgi:nitrogenase molybdenum-cofactor synthesis protein NifE
MSDTLLTIARMLVERGAPADLVDRTQALVVDEEARVKRRLEPYRERLQGRRVLLFTGGVKSWSMISALESAGLEIVGSSVKKSTKEDKERIKKMKGSEFHQWEELKPRDIYEMLRDSKADILLSGGRSQFIALKAKVPWLAVNQERHYAFAGYDGIVNLVEEIDKTLASPMWRQVRQPAPWE